MNAKELIEMTLNKLDRPTDETTIALYQERLLGYLNEGMMDLVLELRPWRRDALPIQQGQAELMDLPRVCRKVISARIDGQRRLFYYGASRGVIHFPGVTSGEAEITYWYQPAQLMELEDEPQLPEEAHPLLAIYAAAKERSRFDAASQNAARLAFTLYREQKGKLRKSFVPAEFPSIYNIY